MWKWRESMIVDTAERVAGSLRDFFGKSRCLQWISSCYPRLESAFRLGGFARMSDAEYSRSAWQYRFREKIMQALENSLTCRACRAFSAFLRETSIGTFGVFGVLYGAFSSAILIADPQSGRSMLSLVASLVLCIASVPLLISPRSLSFGIRHSVLLGTFLFGFCGMSETRFEAAERGKERYRTAIWLAFLCGLGSIYVSSARFLLMLTVLLVGWLLLAIPELCAVLVLFLLPFFNLTTHPTLILAAGVAVCTLAWLIKALCGRKPLHFGLLDLTVLLFALLFLFGGLIGKGGVYGGAVRCLLVMFWFPVRNLLGQGLWRARALAALRWSGGICAVWGIVQYFFTDLELRFVDVSRFADIGGRVYASFSNPNVFAVFLLAVTPLFLAEAFRENAPRVGHAWNTLGFLLCGGCLILTWSRGAWLGILAATVFFFLSHSRKSAGGLLLSVLPTFAVLPFLPHNIVNRFSSIGSLSESSIRYRVYTWQGVLRMLSDHKWGIGVGDRAFGTVYPVYAVSGTERVMHAHHLILQIMIELGIPGCIVLLTFLALLTLYSVHALRELHGAQRTEALGLMCGFLAILIMGMFDYVWYHFGMFCLFFTLCAMLTPPRNMGEEYVT